MLFASTSNIQLQQCKGEVLGAGGITPSAVLKVEVWLVLTSVIASPYRPEDHLNTSIIKINVLSKIDGLLKLHLKRPHVLCCWLICSCDRRGSQHYLNHRSEPGRILNNTIGRLPRTKGYGWATELAAVRTGAQQGGCFTLVDYNWHFCTLAQFFYALLYFLYLRTFFMTVFIASRACLFQNAIIDHLFFLFCYLMIPL